MKVSFFHLLYSLTLVILVGRLHGQSPQLQHFDVEDGLASSFVYQCLQDENGYMWFATDRGITRYDGLKFQSFTTQDGLSSNDVYNIHLDSKGNIWLATFKGICYIKDEKVHQVSNDVYPKKYDKVFHNILDDSTHIIVTTTETGIQNFINGKEIDFGGANNLALFKSQDGNFYAKIPGLQNSASLVKFNMDGEILDSLKFNDRDVNRFLTSSHFALGNDYVFADETNIYRYSEGRIINIPIKSKFDTEEKLLNFGKFKDKIFWRFNNNTYVTDQNFNILEEFDFINLRHFNSTFEDKDKNLWICTGKGVYLAQPQNLNNQHFDFYENGELNAINILHRDQQDNIYIVTDQNYLYRYSIKKGIKSLAHIKSRKINAIQTTKDNQLWYADDDGLHRYNEKSKDRVYTKYHNWISGHSAELKFDADDTFFGCTAKNLTTNLKGDLLFSYATGSSLIQHQNDSISFKRISDKRSYASCQCENGDYYTGGSTGLYQYSKSEINYLGEKDSTLSRFIYKVKCKNNIVWFAVDGFGLFYIKEGKNHSIPELSNLHINEFKISPDNNIWCATDQGIHILNFEDNKTFSYEHQRLTTDNSLASNIIYDIEFLDETVLVGSPKGLTIIDINSIQQPKKLRPIVLQSFSINGESFPLEDHYKLKHNQNNIKINYSQISFGTKAKRNYKYKLEGLTNQWYYTNEHYREFHSLPEGNYTFIIADENEVHKNQISFRIKPPFYKNKLLIGLFALFFLGSIFSFFRLRINRMRTESNKKAELDKKFAELELQALRAQMNPHFIFNSLNAIQQYIAENDERSANKYIVSFARLMRMFLDSSRNKTISLKQEIELLELYIELEQIRFEDKFEYEIIVENGIDPDSLHIPTLLLQPFVENAINHGINLKKSKGLLILRFLQDENMTLQCYIEDDGIGIEKAKQINNRSLGHKSLALEIVTDRQNVINMINNTNISIQIKELKPNIENPGTQVIVSIPVT